MSSGNEKGKVRSFKKTSPKQFEILRQLMVTHTAAAIGYSASTDRALVDKQWREIMEELNKSGPPYRTLSQWKKVWSDTRLRNRQSMIGKRTKRKRPFGENDNTLTDENNSGVVEFLMDQTINGNICKSEQAIEESRVRHDNPIVCGVRKRSRKQQLNDSVLLGDSTIDTSSEFPLANIGCDQTMDIGEQIIEPNDDEPPADGDDISEFNEQLAASDEMLQDKQAIGFDSTSCNYGNDDWIEFVKKLSSPETPVSPQPEQQKSFNDKATTSGGRKRSRKQQFNSLESPILKDEAPAFTFDEPLLHIEKQPYNNMDERYEDDEVEEVEEEVEEDEEEEEGTILEKIKMERDRQQPKVANELDMQNYGIEWTELVGKLNTLGPSQETPDWTPGISKSSFNVATNSGGKNRNRKQKFNASPPMPLVEVTSSTTSAISTENINCNEIIESDDEPLASMTKKNKTVMYGYIPEIYQYGGFASQELVQKLDALKKPETGSTSGIKQSNRGKATTRSRKRNRMPRYSASNGIEEEKQHFVNTSPAPGNCRRAENINCDQIMNDMAEPNLKFNSEQQTSGKRVSFSYRKKTTKRQFDLLKSEMEQKTAAAVGYAPGVQREVVDSEWIEIVQKLNDIGPPVKTLQEWKKTWTDARLRYKKCQDSLKDTNTEWNEDSLHSNATSSMAHGKQKAAMARGQHAKTAKSLSSTANENQLQQFTNAITQLLMQSQLWNRSAPVTDQAYFCLRQDRRRDRLEQLRHWI